MFSKTKHKLIKNNTRVYAHVLRMEKKTSRQCKNTCTCHLTIHSIGTNYEERLKKMVHTNNCFVQL